MAFYSLNGGATLETLASVRQFQHHALPDSFTLSSHDSLAARGSETSTFTGSVSVDSAPPDANGISLYTVHGHYSVSFSIHAESFPNRFPVYADAYAQFGWSGGPLIQTIDVTFSPATTNGGRNAYFDGSNSFTIADPSAGGHVTARDDGDRFLDFIFAGACQPGESFDGGWDVDFTVTIQELPSINVQSVAFGGAGYNAGLIGYNAGLRRDPTPADPLGSPYDQGGQPFDVAQWLDTNTDGTPEQQYPVLYSAGGQMEVKATFDLHTGTPGGTYWVRAVRPDGYVMSAPVEGHLDGDKVTITAQMTPFDATVVRYFKNFAIQWQLSLEDPSWNTWYPAGTSDNTVYVTAPNPLTTSLYQTVVDIATRQNDGTQVADQSSLILNTWSNFTHPDQGVLRADGTTPLHYYNPEETPNTTTATLLQDGNGQCRAFACLFLEALAVNGIAKANSLSYVVPVNPQERMLVNNWGFVSQGHSPDPKYPYLDGQRRGDPTLYHDFDRNPGIAGQASPNPKSEFDNHQLVFLNGLYWDPSYGVTYASLADMEQKSIAGFLIHKDVVVGVGIVAHDLLARKPNASNTDLIDFNGPKYDDPTILYGTPAIAPMPSIDAEVAQASAAPGLGLIASAGGVPTHSTTAVALNDATSQSPATEGIFACPTICQANASSTNTTESPRLPLASQLLAPRRLSAVAVDHLLSEITLWKARGSTFTSRVKEMRT